MEAEPPSAQSLALEIGQDWKDVYSLLAPVAHAGGE